MVQNKHGVVLHIERKHRDDQQDHCAVCGKFTTDLRTHAITEHRPWVRLPKIIAASNIVTENKYQIETTVFDLTQTTNFNCLFFPFLVLQFPHVCVLVCYSMSFYLLNILVQMEHRKA